jgi:hypothetical protein
VIAFDAEGARMFRKLVISAAAVGVLVVPGQAQQTAALADLTARIHAIRDSL